MLRIVIDGAADLPEEWQSAYQIHLLPLNVHFGEETYTQGPGFANDDFYRLVREKRIIPKTSLPSIGNIQAFYRSIAQRGDTILSIHISSKLSGTYNTVLTAASEMGDEFRIFVFDSLAGSAAQAFLAREARQMEQTGACMPEIIHRLEIIRERINIVFTINSLEFAYLSGRVNALQSILASALQLKPILMLKSGLLDIVDRVRTRQRAIDRVLQMMQEKLGSRPANIAVVHAADPHMAEYLAQRVHDFFNVQDMVLTQLSIPVAANLGPGAIGIIAYSLEEEVS